MADAFIADRYGVKAEFLWDKFPEYGVYRNPKSRKWFAIIMDVEYSRIGESKEGKLDPMDLKLPRPMIPYSPFGRSSHTT